MKKFVLAFALVGFAHAEPKVEFPPQIALRILHAPMVAPLADGDRLFYELMLSNHQPEPYELQKLTFLDESGQTVQEWEAQLLTSSLKHFGSPSDTTLVLQPGATAVVYCSVPASKGLRRVSHRLEFVSAGQSKSLQDEGVVVQAGDVPVFSSPFGRGGAWTAASAPSNQSPHRRSMMTLNGNFHISQRYAIDWVLTDEQHRFYKNDGTKLADHYCYGVPAVAVADGTVVDLQDGLAEGPPSQSERPYPITPRTIGGNWVALEVGPKRYAMYAHLQPGSLRVRKGQQVKAGEQLGLIGSSGNSTAPHLHLHLSDRPDWVNAEGVPYRFRSFRCLGSVSTPDDGTHIEFKPYPTGDYREKLPFEDSLVEFVEEK